MSEKVIGVYPLFNTGGICVHAIDYAEDKVLASVNGGKPGMVRDGRAAAGRWR